MRSIFLRFNLLVIISFLFLNFVISPIIDKVAYQCLEKQINQYFVSLFQGPYFVTMKYLESIPENQIPQNIDELQENFGFGIKAVSMADLDITSSEKKLLDTGEILVRGEADIFYQKIGGSELAVVMGPISSFDEVFSLFTFKFFSLLTILFFMAILSLIWAVPFWNDLKKVMDAADLFGKGSLNSRVKLGKRSQFRQLADIFNNMAERIEKLIKSHKLLVNAVSHELRTPISRVRFGLDMLDNSRKEPDRKKYFSGISEDIDELESIVSELLDYAGLDEKSKLVSFEKIETKKWFRDIFKKLAPLKNGKDLILDISKAPEFFKGSPKFLMRAVENLIINGIKYCESRVIVEMEDLNEKIKINIVDDGCGIPEKDFSRVFEPFVRIDESRSRETGGYGLGLSIVKQIVKNHEGEVFVEKTDKGCSMVILLNK